MSLATVDLTGVEILAAGGPIHGRGSPAGGDHLSRDDLREVVDANKALEGELLPAAKIGHGSDAPAVGWLENIRINSDGTKVLADVKGVPRRFADLVKAKAYRTRSVELSALTSQRDGKRYERVISGLAWLGGKMPAVRTLDDVHALYAAAGVELRRVYSEDVEPENVDERWLEQKLGAPVDDVLYGPRSLHYSAGDDAELAERKLVARTYGLSLDEVP